MAMSKKKRADKICTCDGVVTASFISDVKMTNFDAGTEQEFELFHCQKCNKFRSDPEDSIEIYLANETEKNVNSMCKAPTTLKRIKK